jgi:hypothetical protein
VRTPCRSRPPATGVTAGGVTRLEYRAYLVVGHKDRVATTLTELADRLGG